MREHGFCNSDPVHHHSIYCLYAHYLFPTLSNPVLIPPKTSTNLFITYIPFEMSVLLIGGTGKTAVRVAALLSESKKPFLLASRRGPDAAPNEYPAVKFDWTDGSTWNRGFEAGLVEAVYLMEPQVAQPWSPRSLSPGCP